LDAVPPSRFPARLYREGSEPDPRFSLANERTFLAWLRTALALLAAGVALEALEIPEDPTLRFTAVAVFVVIIGGIKSIGSVAEKVVPFMALMYMTAGMIVLIVNADKILWAFGQIFTGAFSAEGVAGGVVGALIQGFKRAAFSNEAGIGSAAIAHSAGRLPPRPAGGRGWQHCARRASAPAAPKAAAPRRN